MINGCGPLLANDIIKRAEGLSVPLLLDGVKSAKIDIPNGGCMDAAISPVEHGMKVVGTAMTVETSGGNNLPIHLASFSVQEDGYVMVIDGKGYAGRAYFGDLIMSTCRAAGFKGMVVDGYTRDRDGNVKLDFPVYSRGFMPRGPVNRGASMVGGSNVNAPIVCAGVKVSPGDLVAGDSDGVCVIPREYVEIVLEEAEKKQEYEKKRIEVIEAYAEAKRVGRKLPQLAPQWVLDILNVG